MPNAYSRAAKAHNHDNEGIRLQKLLAQAGFGSRRKCEEIITDGRVEIDGELITELEPMIQTSGGPCRRFSRAREPEPCHACVEQAKTRAERHGRDTKGRYTLRDIVGDKYERIFHMGRLDYHSEGLILMTNDGELSQHVMHPEYRGRKDLHRHAGRTHQRSGAQARHHGREARRWVDQTRPLRYSRLQPRKHVGQGRAAFGQEPHRAPYFRLDQFPSSVWYARRSVRSNSAT